MKGRVMIGKKSLAQAWVKVYDDSTSAVVQKLESDNEGYVAFQLPVLKRYTMKISKPGYVTKIVTIDANMPRSSRNGDYYFEFGVDLFESIEGLDVSILREPVAKIFFNTFSKKFDYDYNYTAKINKELNMLYDNYNLQKKINKKKGITNSPPKTEMIERVQSDSVKAPEIKSAVGPKTTYSIEIFSSSEQVPRNSPRFKGIVNVKEYQENDLYKYYIGDYASQKDAEKMKDNLSGFFPAATIISFIDGKKTGDGSVAVPQEK